MNIPKGHQAVMPYLMIRNAAGFIDFVKTVFHAELSFSRMREDNTTVMHAEVQISGSTIMFCEATEQQTQQSVNLFVYVPDADETYKAALDQGAATVMELSDQDYGRTCGVKDPFGNVWWVTSVG